MNTKVLITLILFGSFLRLFKLGQIPNSYTPDEVAQGYTAYSLLKTGHDEWGSSNLFSFRSFGDYKPSLQTLLMIPSIKVFGLTPFAIRFPNALFSILLIPLTAVLAFELFHQSRLSLISAMLVTVSPILLPMSRLALEANLIVVVNLLAVIFYLKRKDFFSLFFFGLSLLTYHSAKIIFPLSLFVLFLLVRRNFRSLALGVVIFIFVILITSSSRTGDIIIAHPTDQWQSVAESRYTATISGLPDIVSRLFNNKLTYLLFLFSHNYLSYLSPQFLATSGAGETTYGMLPGQGILGLIAFTGLTIGLILFLRKPKSNSLQLLLMLILIAPIPAALSKGSYSANRLSLISPYLQILAAYGLDFLVYHRSRFLQILVAILFAFESGYFLTKYFFQANTILSQGMLYGHRQVADYLQQFPNHNVIYSRRLSEPQAYVTFWNRVNPLVTQQYSQDWLRYQQLGLKFLDQLGEYRLENYLFKEISFTSDSQIPNSILVGRPEEFPGVTPTKIIYYPDPNHQIPAIYIYHSL